MNGVQQHHGRGAIDVGHFAMACAGFFVAVGGVVVSSVCACLVGLALVWWGVAYFLAGEE